MPALLSGALFMLLPVISLELHTLFLKKRVQGVETRPQSHSSGPCLCWVCSAPVCVPPCHSGLCLCGDAAPSPLHVALGGLCLPFCPSSMSAQYFFMLKKTFWRLPCDLSISVCLTFFILIMIWFLLKPTFLLKWSLMGIWPPWSARNSNCSVCLFWKRFELWPVREGQTI